MNEFHALTAPAYALVSVLGSDRNYRVTLDGVEVADLYLDQPSQEWFLTAREGLVALPPRFARWSESFPTWADLNTYLDADFPRPTAADANTIEDNVDAALRKVGRATYGELRAELAQRDATPAPDFGVAVAEHRRLRQAHAMVARGIAAGLSEIHAGRSRDGLTFLAEAHGTATHHAGFTRAETLPADVPVLAHVRADRLRQQLGGARA